MSTIFKPMYGSGVALTATSWNVASTGLANGAAAACLVVDNTATLDEDALVGVGIASGATGVSATGSVAVYAYALLDGTHYNDGISGTDAAVTLASPTNLRLLGVLSVNANNTTFYGGLFSVARAFGGILPSKWGVVIVNNSGAALATSGNVGYYLPYNGQA